MDVLDGVGCEWILNELGPPPDAILRIPPPPMPSFIDWDGWMKDIAAEVGAIHQADQQQSSDGNDTFPCHWCQHLTRGLNAPAKSTTGPASDAEMAMEETWFFVILASSLMLLLGVLLSGLVYWTLNRKTIKGTWDFGSFFSESSSVLIGGCSSPNGHASGAGNDLLKHAAASSERQADANGNPMVAVPQQAAAPAHLQPPTRALWAGVKTTSEGNHYTITHAQPFEQRVHRAPVNRLPLPDEDSAGYTTLQSARIDPMYPTDNQIYYCCTDLVMVTSPQHRYPFAVNNSYKVTSLDDTMDAPPAHHSLYVNMSAVLPLSHRPPHHHHARVGTPPCSSSCCTVRNGSLSPLNSLAIGRSAVSPAPHMHPVASMSLGENWRKV